MIDIIRELLEDDDFLRRFCEGCPYSPRGTPDDFCPADGSPEETECLRRERFRRIEDAVEDVYRRIAEEVARDGARAVA